MTGRRRRWTAKIRMSSRPTTNGGAVMNEIEMIPIDPVEDPAGPGGGKDAERHAHDDGEAEAGERQHDRVLQVEEDQTGDGLVGDEVRPEIPVQGIEDVLVDLDRDGDVEAHLTAHLLDQGLIGVGAEDVGDRVSRDQAVEDGEEGHDDDERRCNAVTSAPGDVADQHDRTRLTRPMSRPAWACR